jgi:malate dehydrogenase (oxaloacetate-decarboxylating)(NADP+)
VRRSNTLIAAMMIRRGDADAMLGGLVGRYEGHLEHVRDVIGLAPGAQTFAAMNVLMLGERTLFLTDTFVNEEPSAEQLAEIARMAVGEVRRFGRLAKVAFLSHSNFGSSKVGSAQRMREAAERFRVLMPDVECEGEIHGDAALSETVRNRYLPSSRLSGEANILVMPNIDAANILFNVLKIVGGHGVTVGPILLGAARAAHILTPSATVRRIVNMTALASGSAAQESVANAEARPGG